MSTTATRSLANPPAECFAAVDTTGTTAEPPCNVCGGFGLSYHAMTGQMEPGDEENCLACHGTGIANENDSLLQMVEAMMAQEAAQGCELTAWQYQRMAEVAA